MSFRTIGGNEWRDLGTTGQGGRSGPVDTKGYPTMHSGAMYGKVEHETGYGRRSGFQVTLNANRVHQPECTIRRLRGVLHAFVGCAQGSGMGHIGGGGIDGYSQHKVTGRRSVRQRMSSTQDPDINLTPLLHRSDSFSSFSGQKGFSSNKANLGGRHNTDGQIVCKREAFYVVEVTAVGCMLPLSPAWPAGPSHCKSF